MESLFDFNAFPNKKESITQAEETRRTFDMASNWDVEEIVYWEIPSTSSLNAGFKENHHEIYG
jgi:hypothetical protein